MPRKAEAPDNVSALTRGFEVLHCVAAARKPLGNGDIAQATGIPRPTVSRLVATLVSLGHLRPARETERYELAAGVVRLAESFLGGLDVRSHARPHLVALAEATGASAFLGVRDGDEMLVVEAGRARSAVAVIGADVGTRMSLASSALGRAWLAGVDAATRAAVLASWPPDPKLDAALADARRLGHALSLGEWHPNINAVAVPVRTPAGEVVSVNCGSPSFVMPPQRLHEFVIPQLVAAADAFAADIGGVAGLALMSRQQEPPPSIKALAKRRRTPSPTGA